MNRGTGLLIISATNSNPNGDPDAESEPRMYQDDHGLISPVSFKRKLRDMLVRDGAFKAMAVSLAKDVGDKEFDILEQRGRDRGEIGAMSPDKFLNKYWDARTFGNTYIDDKVKDKFIRTGAVQFGPGVSICPVEVVRLSLTNKSGVEDGKDRGLAPLAYRVVRHAVYAMPFFVNPWQGELSGFSQADLDVLKFLLPYAYTSSASGTRSQIEVVHAWYAEHKTFMGSCPDSLILSDLRPKRLGNDADAPSTGIDDYDIPTTLPPNVMSRIKSLTDLCEQAYLREDAA